MRRRRGLEGCTTSQAAPSQAPLSPGPGGWSQWGDYRDNEPHLCTSFPEHGPCAEHFAYIFSSNPPITL